MKQCSETDDGVKCELPSRSLGMCQKHYSRHHAREVRGGHKCKTCGGPKPEGPGVLYCDPCREVAKQKADENRRTWAQRNPEAMRAHQRKSNEKKGRAPCRRCGAEIQYGTPGRLYCSPECVREQRRLKESVRRRNAQRQLDEYKTSRGCATCGYASHGAALDFHHTDPSKKLMRIGATHFVTRSEIVLAELAKCILLCSNCHRVEHALEREASRDADARNLEERKILENGDVFRDRG